MSTPEHTSPTLSLTTLPLEILSIILDKVYEDPHTLEARRPFRATVRTSSDLPTAPLMVCHRVHTESLDAIRRSRKNTATVNLHATFPDIEAIPRSPSLISFYSSVTTLNLVDFPYHSSVLKAWKQMCPSLQQVNVECAYTITTHPPLHRLVFTADFFALLRGDTDIDFAKIAMECILSSHPEFQLEDLEGIRLTFPNFIDFWGPSWKKEYYHGNRVLIFPLTITSNGSFVAQKYFKNRLRSMEYRPRAGVTELPRFPGVDYEEGDFLFALLIGACLIQYVMLDEGGQVD